MRAFDRQTERESASVSDTDPTRPSPAAPPPEPGSPQPPKPPSKEDMPAAGPHGKDHLTDDLKTPGAGTLPDPGDPDSTDSTSG